MVLPIWPALQGPTRGTRFPGRVSDSQPSSYRVAHWHSRLDRDIWLYFPCSFGYRGGKKTDGERNCWRASLYASTRRWKMVSYVQSLPSSCIQALRTERINHLWIKYEGSRTSTVCHCPNDTISFFYIARWLAWNFVILHARIEFFLN